MATTYESDEQRIEKKILELIDLDFTERQIPALVADALVDRDVSSGEYEGCSSELEIAYTTYESLARRALEV